MNYRLCIQFPSKEIKKYYVYSQPMIIGFLEIVYNLRYVEVNETFCLISISLYYFILDQQVIRGKRKQIGS